MKSNPNRECIVAAALRLFARRGYARTSIAEIAEEAGMLKGNLAYYYRTKPDLLTDVVVERRRRIMARLEPDGANEGQPRETILRLVAMVEWSAVEISRSGCPVGSLSGELGKDDDALHAHAAGLLVGIETWLTTHFTRALPPDAARASAEHLLALMQGAAVLAHAHRDPAIIMRQMIVARNWLDGLLPG